MAQYVLIMVTKPGQEQTIKRTFTLSAGWNEANLGVSVWVQDPTGKEVKNARAGILESAHAVEPTSVGRVKALFH